MSPTQDAAQIREIELAVRKANEKFHPLEMFPYFRRWPHSIGRDFIYTFIWSCLIGFTFAAIGVMFGARLSWRLLQEMLLFSVVIGYNIHMLFFIASRTGLESWVSTRGKLVVTAYYTLVPTVGVAAGRLDIGSGPYRYYQICRKVGKHVITQDLTSHVSQGTPVRRYCNTDA